VVWGRWPLVDAAPEDAMMAQGQAVVVVVDEL
jgi:hypothetical protein